MNPHQSDNASSDTQADLRENIKEIIIKNPLTTDDRVDAIMQAFRESLQVLELPEKYEDPDARYLLNIPDEAIDWEALTAQRAFNEAIDKCEAVIEQYKKSL